MATELEGALDPLLAPLAEKLLQHHPDSSLEDLVGAFAVSYTHLTLPTKRIV